MFGVCWKRPIVNWIKILNACSDACARGDFLTFTSLIDAHCSLVELHYHDFFSVGIENPNAECFLTKLLQLDVHKNNMEMGAVHMNYIRSLHARGFVDGEICVRLICEHYGLEKFQFIFDFHGTIACGYDPTFRANTNNFLITLLRYVKHNSIEKSSALSLLKICIENGFDVNARYKIDDGKSAIHYAAENSLWDFVSLFLKNGANLDYIYGGTSARTIIETNQRHLIQDGTIQNSNTDVTCSLFKALYNEDEEQFAVICNQVVHNHLKFEDSDGWYTLTQLAVIKNLSHAVKTILNYGMDVNKISGLKDPPILLAAENGHFEIVLDLVKNSSTKCQVTGDHGDTVLHKLARSLRQKNDEHSYKVIIQIINILLQKCDIDLNIKNRNGETAFKLFLDSNNINILSLLLKKGAFFSVDQNVLNELHNSDLRAMLDSAISTHMDEKGYKIVNLDFECFNLDSNSKRRPEMLALYVISKCDKHSNLLAHPLIKTFLHLKWLKIYWIYFINLLLFFIFVVSLTTYICYSISKMYAPISFTLSIITYIYVFTRELLQFIMSPKQYLLHFENWLHIISLFFTFLFLVFGPHIFISFNVIAIYTEFSLLLGRHPSIASYIAMFQKVSKVNILLLAISLPFMYSFAICFFILFRSEASFQNPLMSLFTTIIMSTGEFDLDKLNFNESSGISEVIFLLFVIFIHIILMNLLHALAVHDTEGIQRDAELVSLRAKIALYTNIEAAWYGFPMKWYSHSWGISNPNWLQLSDRLKNVINISVLPFSKETMCCISIHECGLVIDVSKNGIVRGEAVSIFPGPKILQPLIILITGVHLNTIFTESYEIFCRDRNEISAELQNIKETFNFALVQQTNELIEVKNLILQQNLIIQRLTLLMNHTDDEYS